MRAAPLALAVVIASLPSAARADRASCFDAPVKGQQLRRAGKLRAARDQFLACAQKTCPAEIVEDCARWSSEVELALPSIAVAARDAQGRDLPDATASIDGAATAPIGVRAIRLDPGPHSIVVRRADGVEGQRDVILREGEHDRPVVVTFGANGVLADVPVGSARPVPLAAWIVAGGGALAMVSFGVFGTLGLVSRSSNHCDVGCTAAEKSDVDTKFQIADVSLGIGVVALTVATVLYVLRPHQAQRTTGLMFWGTGGRF